jgi:hypothetical protein
LRTQLQPQQQQSQTQTQTQTQTQQTQQILASSLHKALSRPFSRDDFLGRDLVRKDWGGPSSSSSPSKKVTTRKVCLSLSPLNIYLLEIYNFPLLLLANHLFLLYLPTTVNPAAYSSWSTPSRT